MKSKITRKNRDRQGGHQSCLPSLRAQYTTALENKFAKRLTRKKLRRDHAKALRGAEQEYQEMLYQDSLSFWGYENEFFDSSYDDYEMWRDGYYDSEYVHEEYYFDVYYSEID